MKKIFLFSSLAVVFGLATHALGQQQSAQQNAPKVKVGSSLGAKANSPAPPPTAKNKTQKTSIGKGKTAVKVSQPSSFWVEELDVDDDGTAETSDFLYDAQRGVLYTYREDDFTCPNGKPESGSILEALYAKGNSAGKPVGSGWYVVGLNAGQCAAKQSGALRLQVRRHRQSHRLWRSCDQQRHGRSGSRCSPVGRVA
jgi:hypothetical protein